MATLLCLLGLQSNSNRQTSRLSCSTPDDVANSAAHKALVKALQQGTEQLLAIIQASGMNYSDATERGIEYHLHPAILQDAGRPSVSDFAAMLVPLTAERRQW